MSGLPENELDLEKLFLPAWAQEPASAKQYSHYEGGDERPDRRGDRRERRPGRGQPGGPRREGGGPRGERRGPKREESGRRGWTRDRGNVRGAPRERSEPPPPLPEVSVSFIPELRGVESLARQIKMAGRAYPLFDIARLILQKPERHSVVFSARKKPDGQIAQPLFVCALDETLWLSEDAAIAHVLRNHFATFYQAERTATEPPKGKYTFVAQCGMSGVILGPPNYHDYQNQLRKLHAERFSRMPFEAFKARVKIVRDEEVVKKWIDDQSWKTEFICLNLPEPVRLPSREAVEKHFRETHKETIIKSVESHTLDGIAARNLRTPELARLLRQSWEDQRRFPLQIATVLSQQFASHGLQFFKVNKAITHVSVARPHFLDLETTPVSEGVKRIVEFINANPKCTRRKLMEALAPDPNPAPATGATEVAQQDTPTAPPVTPRSSEPTPEQTALIADLHWLVHQGHVIEFANGILETAKKPAPKPPKQPKPEAPAEGATVEAASAEPAPTEPASAPSPENGSAGEVSIDPGDIPVPQSEASEAPKPQLEPPAEGKTAEGGPAEPAQAESAPASSSENVSAAEASIDPGDIPVPQPEPSEVPKPQPEA